MTSSAAPVLAPVAPPAQGEGPDKAVQRPGYQPSLFSTREAGLRVIPFKTTGPVIREVNPETRRATRPRSPRSSQASDQQALFPPAHIAPEVLQKSADAVTYCEAPVALPAHRMLATAIDASMVMIGVAIFVSIFSLAGGELVFNRTASICFAAMTFAIAVFYKLLWCFGGADSFGMRSARLRLVNFDGHPPSREQRFQRLATGYLSLFAAGLGLLWAAVDEESLAWHDHISKTFPTPGGPAAPPSL